MATDEDGRVLVWSDATAVAPVTGRATAPERAPLSYTPQHLADKILTSRSALEGERKHVTVLFADVAGFTTLAVQQAPTPADAAWSRSYLAWAYCRAGALHRWLDELAQLIAQYRAARFIWSEIYALCLGEGYWLAGAYDQASQTLTGVLDTARRCGMRFAQGSAQRLLGEVALHTEPSQAAAHFESSLSILQQIGADNELALAYAGSGRRHVQRGNSVPARDYLTQALAIFERLGTLGEPDKVRQVLAALPSSQ